MKNVFKYIKKINPDFILVVGWYYIIPKEILNYPKYGCAGLHASLLPKYRGGAPINWAIINGEKKTGITFFYFGEGVDSGDIIGQRAFKITLKDNCRTVYEKAIKSGIYLLKKYIPLIERNKAPRIKQDESKATYFPQRKPEDGLINWGQSALKIYNFIRAQTYPYPGAYTFYKKNKIIIWEAKISNFKSKEKGNKPGQILRISKKGILTSTLDGKVIITKAGRKYKEILSADLLANKLKIKELYVWNSRNI